MNISEPFIRKPIGTSLLMIGILIFGVASYKLLPVSALPTVDFPTISVSATLPGASPDTMASAVATPLEQQFAAIPGLAQMTSTSGLGTTSITLQFDLNRNIDAPLAMCRPLLMRRVAYCRRICRARRPTKRPILPSARS
jgi:multidrug efflux pump subunit AcrB